MRLSERKSIAGTRASTPPGRARRRPPSPPGRSTSHASADRLGPADHLERVVDAPVGELDERSAAGLLGRRRRRRRWRRGDARSRASRGSRSTATIGAAPASAARRRRPAGRRRRSRSPRRSPPAARTRRSGRRRSPSSRRTRAAPPARAAARGGSGTAPWPSTTVRSAKQAVSQAVLEARAVRSRRRDRPVHQRAAHAVLARRHAQVEPPGEAGRAGAARRHERRTPTRSPGATCVTPSPTASTTPAPSCPSTIGQRPVAESPSARWRSEWQTPAAATWTSTSPRLGGVELHLLDLDLLPGCAQHGRPHPASATRQRSSASRSGSTPEAGARRRRDRAVGSDLDRGRQQPVAPLRRPGRRVVRHLDVRHRRERERRVQVRRAARSPFDQVCGDQARPWRSASAAIAPAAADAADEHDVGLEHVDAAADDEVARLVLPAHHLAGREPERWCGRRSAA